MPLQGRRIYCFQDCLSSNNSHHSKLDDFVKFLQLRQEKDEIKQGFYDLAGFLCEIGCVDGSHVRIIAPSENECNFVNRKG